MQTTTRKISELSADHANARKHPERNLAAIVASLRRFGQQKPIVVDCSGVVRAGNGTLEAAKQLGWETIECVEMPLKGSEATAYAIADNRTAELAEWDDEILAATLNGLVVAEQLGRKCFGMEISPKYCDVIVKRWENLTGKKAELCPTT